MIPGKVTLLFLLASVLVNPLRAQDSDAGKQDTTVKKGTELSLFANRMSRTALSATAKWYIL